ncbi:MAG TPA: FAD-dependent oxidoreductase [Arenimonas sp.]|nr:FAD-dependent oxidoreductase [Arenimonas sp.]HOZ03911.1 FAD-dependent oxidoreductase [Arenimonas sp.]HPO24644.1 FAD-dependent oxidoreductase [Arenimonas sp.]HPW31509.1 FAD-dependent oxidoreductase [Arenimonas sp.]
MKSFDIAVVGAGIVGGCAALSLARAGYRVALIEAHEPKPWSESSPDLRVVALAPDNQKLLEACGVWHTIANRRIQPYSDMRVWDAAAGNELHLSAAQHAKQFLGFIVENNNIADALWQAIKHENRISCFCPEKLESISQENGVTLTLESGVAIKSGLVLGADGASSKVRELLGLKIDRKDYGQRGLVAYVKTELAHENTAWQRFLPTGPLAFLPFNDGRCSIVWTLPNEEAERLLHCDEETFCRELARAFDGRLGKVVEVSKRAAFPLQRQLSSEMLIGHIALIGDAAHAVHPLAGQGVNLGLRDVSSLLDLLGEMKKTSENPAQKNESPVSRHKLERWSRKRLSENAVAAYSFETINRAFSNDDVLPTLLRGHAFGIANAISPIRNFLLRQATGR